MKEFTMPSRALLSICKLMQIFFAMNKLPKYNLKALWMTTIKITTPDSKELDEKGYHLMEFPDVMIDENLNDIYGVLKQKYNIDSYELTCVLTSIKVILITEKNLSKCEMKNFNKIYERILDETKR